MPRQFSQAQLDAFLDEALPGDVMAEIEDALREDGTLARDVAAALGRRDAGVHTMAAIWRRNRLTCASRETLGSYLLGVLDEGEIEYIEFHINVVGCRYCQSNLDDLQQRVSQTEDEATTTRRKRYFQSSAGYLKDEE